MNQAELAWAAGFFEGEGTVYTNMQRTYTQPRLALCMTSTVREHLERFMEAVQCGNITGPVRRKDPNLKPQYRWAVQGAKAHEAMMALEPHFTFRSPKWMRYIAALEEGCRPERKVR